MAIIAQVEGSGTAAKNGASLAEGVARVNDLKCGALTALS
jgi:hypothetical protein